MEKSDIQNIRIEDFNYPLPDERIAKHPLAEREMCKLLTYCKGEIGEYLFKDIPELLPADSMLVYNNTRVINARLRFQKPNQGAIIEVFCLEPLDPSDYGLVFQTTGKCRWLCFVGNAKRWKDDSIFQIVRVKGGDICLTATKAGRKGNAFEIEFTWDNSERTFADILDAIGEIPIPPYLNRKTEESDSSDYQTVYSHIDGSVAAPTAGLHFTDEVLERISKKGIERRELTLHVGAGTFQPVKSDTIGDHAMHTEFISVTRSLLEDLIAAQGAKRVIAVGTTSVRTLESLYYIGIMLHNNPDATGEELTVPQWLPYEGKDSLTTKEALEEIIAYLDRHHTDTYLGDTQIMIAPGYSFHLINGMVTNFHQPQSTLLLLVSAFVDGNWKSIYDYALSHDFRFLSYGDGSLLLR